MFGMVSKKWAILQQEEYTQITSQQTGKRWIAALIRKTWEIAWAQWVDEIRPYIKAKKLWNILTQRD